MSRSSCKIAILGLVAIGAVAVTANDADAGWRRRHRHNNCCAPVVHNDCGCQGYQGGCNSCGYTYNGGFNSGYVYNYGYSAPYAYTNVAPANCACGTAWTPAGTVEHSAARPIAPEADQHHQYQNAPQPTYSPRPEPPVANPPMNDPNRTFRQEAAPVAPQPGDLRQEAPQPEVRITPENVDVDVNAATQNRPNND